MDRGVRSNHLGEEEEDSEAADLNAEKAKKAAVGVVKKAAEEEAEET